MGKCVIYSNGNGISIIVSCDNGFTIEQIAKKDVPYGVKYRIIDASEIPSDRSQREAWKADFSTYDGVGGQA